ncbi:MULTISPECIES: CO2 hydration protein [unclassified Synechococcus]|uniref:CO2 hydration protein n=1 Tax=unclassified Synechococcus TaxID=2626047 RepID=UPI000069894B|nr:MULTISPECIES: CO2 hydration protein [unclassified Synechococcus]EAQ74793.1 CO2 hydration [Synechococcus sp. WH 5701]WFN58183.1 CO2 hydration protein [Synechococcus sp. CCFWC 502]
MPIIPAELVYSGGMPSAAELDAKLLAGETLLANTPDHLIEVVDVLKSYGEVLDAYSTNLIYQAEKQFLLPFPLFKYLDGHNSPARIWRHLNHDRINFEYAEYCMKTMLWHGTGGLDAYLDSEAFAENCAAIIRRKTRRDPLLAVLHPLFPGFLIELIRTAATTHALGQFWRVMSDLFLDLARAEADGRVDSIDAVVEFIKDGLVAAAANPITYGVEVIGEHLWVLPPKAGLTFLMDVAVPYVEAVFLRGTPFLGTVSFNAQAHQISPDQAQFAYGALYADPLPSMGAGIPPSLLMQDMYRHLPERLHSWYHQRTRGEGDVRVKICMSFQKSMFCVTNAAIRGTFPHPLSSTDPAEQAANRAYAAAWSGRLAVARTDCLDPSS